VLSRAVESKGRRCARRRVIKRTVFYSRLQRHTIHRSALVFSCLWHLHPGRGDPERGKNEKVPLGVLGVDGPGDRETGLVPWFDTMVPRCGRDALALHMLAQVENVARLYVSFRSGGRPREQRF